MAEEKIRVLVAKDPCENCKLKPCARKCIFAQMYENESAIAKSNAIEKMAIAMLKADTPENNENDVLIKLKLNDTHILKIYKIYAEAALNALLEDNK